MLRYIYKIVITLILLFIGAIMFFVTSFVILREHWPFGLALGGVAFVFATLLAIVSWTKAAYVPLHPAFGVAWFYSLSGRLFLAIVALVIIIKFCYDISKQA